MTYKERKLRFFIRCKESRLELALFPLSFFELEDGILTVTERPTTFKKVGGNLYLKSACIGTATFQVDGDKLIITTK